MLLEVLTRAITEENQGVYNLEKIKSKYLFLIDDTIVYIRDSKTLLGNSYSLKPPLVKWLHAKLTQKTHIPPIC